MTTQLTEAGRREALTAKIRHSRDYAEREGFTCSSLCLPHEDADILLAALAPKTSVPGNDAGMRGALKKIAELRYSDAGEPFDDALAIADAALTAAPAANGEGA